MKSRVAQNILVTQPLTTARLRLSLMISYESTRSKCRTKTKLIARDSSLNYVVQHLSDLCCDQLPTRYGNIIIIKLEVQVKYNNIHVYVESQWMPVDCTDYPAAEVPLGSSATVN